MDLLAVTILATCAVVWLSVHGSAVADAEGSGSQVFVVNGDGDVVDEYSKNGEIEYLGKRIAH